MLLAQSAKELNPFRELIGVFAGDQTRSEDRKIRHVTTVSRRPTLTVQYRLSQGLEKGPL